MKDYYALIEGLSMQLICSKDDYEDKKKVKKHNMAMRKIYDLHKELYTTQGQEILLKLLNHVNEMVVMSAAMLCFMIGCNENEAVSALKIIARTSKDPIIRFDAEMTIKEKDNLKVLPPSVK